MCAVSRSRARFAAFFQENGFRSIAARLGTDGGEATLAEEEAEPNETAPLPASYPLVTDAAALVDWAEKARESGVLALEPFRSAGSPEGAGLAGVALATAPGEACYVPLGHASPDLLEAAQASAQLDLAEALAVLDPVLTDPGVLKLGLDIKQTLRLLSHARANARPGRRCDAGLLGARRQPAWPCSRGPDAAPSRPRGTGACRRARQRAQQGFRRRGLARGAAGYRGGGTPISRSASTASFGRASSLTVSPRCSSGSNAR